MTDDAVRQLQEALDTRVVIEQAKGILAVRQGLPVGAAFEQLRSEARRRRSSIRSVAGDVVQAHEDSIRRTVVQGSSVSRRESV